jgi:hypothetical protein
MMKQHTEEPYRFTSDAEPTKEQLDTLMRAVLEDVKERAAKAEAKFKDLQEQALIQIFERWQNKQKNNECQ